MKLRKRFNDEAKKINKKKQFDFLKKMNSVREQIKFINNICRFRNKN